MDTHRRNRLAFGILLILVGFVFLAIKMVPGLNNFLMVQYSWPFIVIGVGVFLLIFGILAGSPGMAVPASIVAGIGGILYWQNNTARWDTWSYLWTLIPGFIGAGILLSSLIGGSKNPVRQGLRLIFLSAVLFLIFGSFLGGLDLLGPYWPILLIIAGVLILIMPVFRKRSS